MIHGRRGIRLLSSILFFASFWGVPSRFLFYSSSSILPLNAKFISQPQVTHSSPAHRPHIPPLPFPPPPVHPEPHPPAHNLTSPPYPSSYTPTPPHPPPQLYHQAPVTASQTKPGGSQKTVLYPRPYPPASAMLGYFLPRLPPSPVPPALLLSPRLPPMTFRVVLPGPQSTSTNGIDSTVSVPAVRVRRLGLRLWIVGDCIV